MSRGTLYVVATPLGNLADLSERARDVLRSVELVAAEDTRRSRTLLHHAGAGARLVSVHAHAPAGHTAKVLSALAAGSAVALLTDAGTPGISDPGAELVRQARAAGASVVVVPGPTAVAAALSISGLPADRYTFVGFLPRAGAARRRLLQQIAASEWTVVVFEAPHRTAKLLEDLAAILTAERPTAVARELTKVHEECRTGTLGELAGYYRENPPRGEVTVIVAGRTRAPSFADPATARARARALLAEGLSRKDVAGRLVRELGLPRNEAYRLAADVRREE
ncbi:MAG: 16S rRNA (cytidine(1402)-2'-O)-methyltransferase [Gemmatimonadetes bacterium]|nr:16S rRNA (cytidine(1402)-2'-O)-methyltransferase [Gemmatimonadota bacterium]